MPNQPAYKDLLVWQKAMDFAHIVIDLVENLNTPQKHYRLTEQLEAAATSIPMNNAEGKGRNSKKEFIHHLYIARGSIFETLTLIEIFKVRNWINDTAHQDLETRGGEIARMLNALISSVKPAISE